MSTDITSGVGRIVWGHPMKGRPKLDDNKQPVIRDGKPVTQWAFGVAFPKAEFTSMIWPTMAAEAQRLFPSGTFPPNFAFKYDDGDGVDSKGQPFTNRTGYAGCYIVAISTEAFQPSVVRLVNGVYVAVSEGEIKTGDFVRVGLNIDAHGPNPKKPGSASGLYVNPRLVELVGAGEAILNGPDPSSVFGGQQVALPPGATPIGAAPAAPTAALPLPPPAGQPAPVPPMQPQPVPAPSIAPVVAPVAPSPAVPPVMPGGFSPAPTVSPSNVQPHPSIPPAIVAPPPPVAPPATPQYTIPAGSPIPAGYRYIGVAADGQWLITTP